jgi:hypothetical protein
VETEERDRCAVADALDQEKQPDDRVLASIVWDYGTYLENVGIAYVRRRDGAFLYRQFPEELRGFGRATDLAEVSAQTKAICLMIRQAVPKLHFCIGPGFGPTRVSEGNEPEWLRGINRYIGRSRVGIDLGEYSMSDEEIGTIESAVPPGWVIVRHPARDFWRAIWRWLRNCPAFTVCGSGK